MQCAVHAARQAAPLVCVRWELPFEALGWLAPQGAPSTDVSLLQGRWWGFLPLPASLTPGFPLLPRGSFSRQQAILPPEAAWPDCHL